MDRNAVILFSDEQNIIIDDFWQGHDWQVAIFIYLFFWFLENCSVLENLSVLKISLNL